MPKDGHLEHFPFYIPEWRNSERIDALHPSARAGYLELLTYCWETGDLPADDAWLSRRSRLDNRSWTRHRSQIIAMFENVSGRLRSAKVDDKRPDIIQNKEKRRASGKAGNEARWGKKQELEKSQTGDLGDRSRARSQTLTDTRSQTPDPPANEILDQPHTPSSVERDPNELFEETFGRKQIRKIKPEPWVANIEEFKKKYPGDICNKAIQQFVSVAKSPEDEQRLFANLSLWAETDSWRRGYVKSALNWLRDGLWEQPPKAIKRAVEEMPAWKREIEEMKAKERAEEDEEEAEEVKGK